MPHYELCFIHDMDTGDEVLFEGDAYGYGGEVWLVEHLEPVAERELSRVYLSLWPNGVPYPSDIKGATFLRRSSRPGEGH